VWLFGIIPDKVFHEDTVKDIRLLQFIRMPVSELFLYCPVEALQMAVGLGVAGVVEVVHETLFLTCLGKVFLEFVTIIGLNPSYVEWGYASELHEEVPGTYG